MNKRSLHISFWASMARLIGVGLGSGAGSIVYQTIGSGVNGWETATIMAILAFIMMWYSEYERENHRFNASSELLSAASQNPEKSSEPPQKIS